LDWIGLDWIGLDWTDRGGPHYMTHVITL